MIEQLTIASANTQMGRALEPSGLGAVATADILLLQEVTLPEAELELRLKQETDTVLVNFDPETSLAIAARPDYTVHKNSQQISWPRNRVNQFIHDKQLSDHLSWRWRPRGLIYSTFETHNGNQFSVATAHPIVPGRAKARKQQVLDIPIATGSITGPFVLGLDENHWPGPQKVDIEMARRSKLIRVDLGNQSTFDLGATDYAQWGKVAVRLGFNLNWQLDSMYYRGNIEPVETRVLPIASDHFSIMTTFELG